MSPALADGFLITAPHREALKKYFKVFIRCLLKPFGLAKSNLTFQVPSIILCDTASRSVLEERALLTKAVFGNVPL